VLVSATSFPLFGAGSTLTAISTSEPQSKLVRAVSVELENAPPEHDLERGFDRVTSVAVVIGVVATVIAGATIWLVLTDPVTVANALDEGEISPLVQQLAEVIYNALSGLLEYL